VALLWQHAVNSVHSENTLATFEAILRQSCGISLAILLQFCGHTHCDHAVAIY
jgi:hypothetical protein